METEAKCGAGPLKGRLDSFLAVISKNTILCAITYQALLSL